MGGQDHTEFQGGQDHCSLQPFQTSIVLDREEKGLDLVKFAFCLIGEISHPLPQTIVKEVVTQGNGGQAKDYGGPQVLPPKLPQGCTIAPQFCTLKPKNVIYAVLFEG